MGMTTLVGWTGPVLLSALLIMAASAVARGDETKDGSGKPEIRVGIEDGDIRGDDHRALQAAVDYIAGLGGGTVRIGPGRYVMRNALMLRDNVHVYGTPGKTVLTACDVVTSPLTKDGDCNQREISLADPSGFRVGDGVAVSDDQWGAGFCVTTATLTEQLDPNTFRITTPLYLDYYVAKKATARLSFPVVGGWHVKGVVVEGLVVEGNRENGVWLDGCRGGGLYLFECEDVTFRDCVVRGYNGDGIAFQVSHDVVVENCLAEDNAGYGLHPGSGSQRPILRGNRSMNNGSDGLFVCWRVQNGLFEDNEIRGNGRVGISIGHKDSDNVFRDNTIVENKRAGVSFRQEDEPMGAHRNLFENNRILDNGGSGAALAAVVITGNHNDVVFRANTIGNSEGSDRSKTGVFLGKDAKGFLSKNNQFTHVQKDVETEE